MLSSSARNGGSSAEMARKTFRSSGDRQDSSLRSLPDISGTCIDRSLNRQAVVCGRAKALSILRPWPLRITVTAVDHAARMLTPKTFVTKEDYHPRRRFMLSKRIRLAYTQTSL